PPRREPIIIQRPSADPSGFERPGQWAYNLPEFLDKGGKLLEVSQFDGPQADALHKVLNDNFGTPASPKVGGLDDESRKVLFKVESEKQLNDNLAEGSRLFRRHCLHCHGLPGDGHGPTAPWVNPHPRDFRPGKFKFTSTLGGNDRKPSRNDLLRTLKQGVEGTAMPSFNLLTDQELERLIDYVIHLSIRGQVEYDTYAFLFQSKASPQEVKDFATGSGDYEGAAGLPRIVETWAKAEKGDPIPVGPYPDRNEEERLASVRRGYQRFVTAEAQCITCHLDFGRQNTYRYDDWGTVVRPRDLTAGLYRGGRRPVDLYYRVYNGINGTPMPAYVSSGSSKAPEQWNREVWDLVNFVQALPYPNMLPDDVREKVYGKKKDETKRAER
ncbi:MAG TPA: cytochrome c, partial [Gemmataceae bacterium]|nr:cytochrome c [Gemmataceae bacterium]